MALTASVSIWPSFTQKAVKEALKKMRLKIPGGKMVGKQYIHYIQRNNGLREIFEK
jgi:hypothetical protein